MMTCKILRAAAPFFFALSSGHTAQAQTVPGQPPQKALTLEASYTGDVWYNASGGLKREATYLDNLDLVLAYDAEQGLGLSGTTATASLLYNNRNTFSEPILGDLQTVSNIDTDGALRLYELWIDQRLGRAALKVGLIDVNSEFDVNETGSLFLNSSHGIGPDFSQVGPSGPGIFPVTALGARLSWNAGALWEARAGVFEGTPGDPDNPRRTTLRLESGEGALVVGELIARPKQDLRIALGAWHHDGDRTSGHGEDWGSYAHVEGKLWSGSRHSLGGFARVGWAHGNVYRIGRYEGAGLVFSGPLLSGSADEALGIAVASASNSKAFRDTQRSMNIATTARETAIELTYRLPVASWLTLQPDVQYINNPGTDPDVDDAIAIGMRFVLTWPRRP